MKTLIVKNGFFMLWVCFICLLSMPLQAAEQQDYISNVDKSCPSPLNKPQSNDGSTHLDCKSYYQTTNYTCGPAAVMTLMRYYGRLTSGEMNQKMELRIAAEMGVTSEGASMSQVSDWLESHGFKVDTGRRVTSSMIIKNLQRGIPTLILMNNHWILAKGYSKDEIAFSDSCCSTDIVSASGIDSMSDDSMMPENHCSQNVGQYIVATPK